jgi:hypothetical protein
VIVTVDVAAAAVSAAERVVFGAVPGVRVSVAGLAVTPGGRPVIATATVLANPFVAAAVTLRGDPIVPAVIVMAAGDTPRVKSGMGPIVRETAAE